MTQSHSGGCQCGAVRYRVSGALSYPHICHCRMCQKAAGNYFMPLANAQQGDFVVTRGEVAWFSSSALTRRGFCRECGTPLVFETIGAPHLNVTLGSLDQPASLRPAHQYGIEAQMPWLGDLFSLPGRVTEEDPDQDGASTAEIAATNRQHPDHDTDQWPPKGEKS